MNDVQISVVIPAFKGRFLGDALASLTRQSDRNFEVVVADDASDEDLQSICLPYQHRLLLVYRRFEENMGHRDLVAHWQRALCAASNDWIWLMGDDDELDAECIASARREIARDPTWKGLWRVNVARIDAKGTVIAPPTRALRTMTSADYLQLRCSGDLESFACEFIFRRSTLEASGGFKSFPLAWCSDDATWLRLSASSGIRTIESNHAVARWRQSALNISGQGQSSHGPKLEARLQYLEWLSGPEGQRLVSNGARLPTAIAAACNDWFYRSLSNTRTVIPVTALLRVARRLAKATGQPLLATTFNLFRQRHWITIKVRQSRPPLLGQAS